MRPLHQHAASTAATGVLLGLDCSEPGLHTLQSVEERLRGCQPPQPPASAALSAARTADAAAGLTYRVALDRGYVCRLTTSSRNRASFLAARAETVAASLTPNAPSRIILEVRPAQFALKNAASIERGSASPLPPITRRQGHGLPPMPRQAGGWPGGGQGVARGVKFGRKRSYTPQQAAAVMEMRRRGDGYGTIASAMGMTDSMVRRIIQQQEAAA